MSEKTGFTLETKVFEASLLKFANENKNLAEVGLWEGFNMLLADAKWKPPQAPFKQGDLHGSAEVDEMKITPAGIEVSGGFNIEYAVYVHEREGKFKSPTTSVVKQPGPKFLETKMVQYAKDYIEPLIKQLRKLYT